MPVFLKNSPSRAPGREIGWRQFRFIRRRVLVLRWRLIVFDYIVPVVAKAQQQPSSLRLINHLII